MNKKIKVLQFTISNEKGGITYYQLRNWAFIDKSRFQFDFATMSRQLDFADELLEQGCKIHYISCYAEENEEQFIKEINRILEEGYDVIHLHNICWKGFLVEKLAREKKVPTIIVHSHSAAIDEADEKERIKAIELHEKQKALFSEEMATDFWACSQLASDWLFGEKIPRDRIRILKNAVDTDLCSYKAEIRERYRQKMQLEDCFVLGHVGAMNYQKNHEMLIDIFKKVSDENQKARLLLIGDGMLLEKIHKQANDYGIEDKILFLGKSSDVANLLQAMDVFVFPSKSEGLPLALIEAQTAGLPCLVGEAVTREAQIISNIEYLPYKISEWVEKILYISQGYKRTDMSDEVAKAGFSLKEQIKVIEQLYASRHDER